jgi:hypothetical protein
MQEILEKIFSSPRHFKEVAFFIRTKTSTGVDSLKSYLKISSKQIKKDLESLVKLGVLKRDARTLKYSANPNFFLFPELEKLFEKEFLLIQKNFARILNKSGNIKLLILSGELVKDLYAPTDMTVVGDRLKEKYIEKTIHELEKINGVELRYTIFNTKEFLYRFQVRDAFIKEILTRPRNVLINKDGFLDELI